MQINTLDLSYSCSLIFATIASGVSPNFSNKSLGVPDSPNTSCKPILTTLVGTVSEVTFATTEPRPPLQNALHKLQ